LSGSSSPKISPPLSPGNGRSYSPLQFPSLPARFDAPATPINSPRPPLAFPSPPVTWGAARPAKFLAGAPQDSSQSSLISVQWSIPVPSIPSPLSYFPLALLPDQFSSSYLQRNNAFDHGRRSPAPTPSSSRPSPPSLDTIDIVAHAVEFISMFCTPSIHPPASGAPGTSPTTTVWPQPRRSHAETLT
jgi:hypothetical protein